MTVDERREMLRNNYAAQMEMLGYQPDGSPKDLAEVVRCKDCKYCKVIDWDDSNPNYGSCQYFNTHTVDADGFCYKAERKDSD